MRIRVLSDLHEEFAPRLGATISFTHSNVHLLDGACITVKGIRFVGTTLWTDYCLDGKTHQARSIQDASMFMNDYRLIQTNAGIQLTALDTVSFHNEQRRWLQSQLDQASRDYTVVITHHGPHPNSIHSQYAGNSINAAFVSNLETMMGQSAFWIHGHTHNSFDYVVNGTRVIVNPAGYRQGFKTTTGIDWDFENPLFNPDFVIEI